MPEAMRVIREAMLLTRFTGLVVADAETMLSSRQCKELLGHQTASGRKYRTKNAQSLLTIHVCGI